MDELEKEVYVPSTVLPTPQLNAAGAQSSSSRAAARAQEQEALLKAEKRKLFLFLLGVAGLLNCILGYVLFGLMVTDVSHAHEDQLIQQELDSGVKQIDNFILPQIKKLKETAENKSIIQALKDNDKVAINLLTEPLISQFGYAVAVKVFPVGGADIDLNALVPIRFAELDLIRRAEKAEKPMPEASLISGKLQIHLVSEVREAQDQPVLGVLMLTLNGESLQRSWSQAATAQGEKVLMQKFITTPEVALIKSGAGSAMPARLAQTQNKNWQIKFTASDSLVDEAAASLLPWSVTILISVILSFGAALSLARWLIKQKEDKKQLNLSVSEATKPSSMGVVDGVPNHFMQAKDIFNIDVIDEDENILGLHNTDNKKQAFQPETYDEAMVPAHIFRSYDIRGVVGKDLDNTLAEKIGQAIGTEAIAQGEGSLVVARDGRIHSKELMAALVNGILSTGCNVINVGVAPTPLMYFATFFFDDVRSGVMVTASHNPAEYNGFKVVIKNSALADEAITRLRTRIVNGDIVHGAGQESAREIIPQYIERIFSDVALAGDISLVIDAGNGVTGAVAPKLFEELGCQVTPLFCELDGRFPNHDPDPTQEENLVALIRKVKEVNADMGVAFDGDGDRLVVVTAKGHIIWPDRLLMLFVKDILARHPGTDIVFDVKCSRQLNQVISSYGGRPIMWKTGHSPMKAKMVETGALIGGEYSGHIFIKDRWYGFDDGMYAMARLLEIITLRDQSIDDIFSAFPQLITTNEIKLPVAEGAKFDIIRKLTEQSDFQQGNVNTVDGVRVDYSKGWGLVRASNTSPALTLRFEAENEEALALIKQIFKRELAKIDNTLELNF